MNTDPAPEPDWLLMWAIVGGFLIIFPLFWCTVVGFLSWASGWRHLAARYASGKRPVTGACHRGLTGMVGGVSYRSSLTVCFESDGFFLEVMRLFRIGQPRLFIPWSEVTGRKPRAVLWWRATSLSIGMPVIGTITLPADLVEQHAPV